MKQNNFRYFKVVPKIAAYTDSHTHESVFRYLNSLMGKKSASRVRPVVARRASVVGLRSTGSRCGVAGAQLPLEGLDLGHRTGNDIGTADARAPLYTFALQ